MLRTLGGLALDGEVRQPKPLLLLCYLALEGASSREHLSALFWPTAARPLSNLSVALSTLTKEPRTGISASAKQVGTTLTTDLQAFLNHLDADEISAAELLYHGPFLLGTDGTGLGNELEEWVLATREFAARRYQNSLLGWAARRADEPQEAAALAHFAFTVAGAPALEPETLTTLHALLSAGRHPGAVTVERELAELGLYSYEARSEGAGSARVQPSTRASTRKRAVRIPRSNRPQVHQAIVGRDAERIAAASLITQSDCRLLTFHGVGGTGKTRLAIQVAADLEATGAFSAGQVYLPLENARSGFEVATYLALQLGKEPVRTGSLAAMFAALLPSGPTLLVMDNVEQIAGLSSLIPDLLEACPELKILATSRELIGCQVEMHLPLGGLAYPDSDQVPESPESFDSLMLYDACARRADPDFVLDSTTLPHVVSICRTVQGSPLGIELAAAWSRAVASEEIARGLTADIDFLRRPGTGGTPVHDSARSSFERSWRRLAPKEAAALAALSVFHGGFQLTSGLAVARCSVAIVASLVDKSLLRLVNGVRYDMHPLVLRFAREKLGNRPRQFDRASDLHSSTMLQLLAELDYGVRSLDRHVLGRVDDEFANVREAWMRAVSTSEPVSVSRAALVLARYCDARARLKEGRALLAGAAAVEWIDNRSGRAARGRANVGLAWLEMRLDLLESAEEHCELGLSCLSLAQDEDALTWARQVLASIRYKQGDYQTSLSLFKQVLGTAGDSLARADGLGRLGLVEQALGAYQEARRHYLESLAIHRSQSFTSGVITLLLNLGALELNSSSPATAGELFEEALDLARTHGYEQIVPILLHNLANVACKSGSYARARALAREALERVTVTGERGLQSGMLATLSWIELEAKNLRKAEEYAYEALVIAGACDDEPAEQTARLRLGQVMLAAGRSQDGELLLASVENNDKALTWARRLAGRLRTEVT